ncbi:MAG: hypothetical protein RBS39_09795 [Phycisphaerales bacterium]|nr:hypothetical protein [Phycisphaerales bacterium]
MAQRTTLNRQSSTQHTPCARASFLFTYERAAFGFVTLDVVIDPTPDLGPSR